MKKSMLLNAAMVLIIVAIGIGAVVGVNAFKGGSKEVPALGQAESVVGIASLQRGGISYNLEKGADLFPGDSIETAALASVVFCDSALDENGVVSFSEEDGCACLEQGTLFSRLGALSIFDGKVAAEQAVYVAESLTGSAGIKVLAGDVTYEKDGTSYQASAGQQISILESEISVRAFTAQELSDFSLRYAREAPETLFVSVDELSEVQEQREQERLHASDEEETASDETDATSTDSETSGNESSTSTSGSDDTPASSSQSESSGQSSGESDSEAQAPVASTCTIQIRCDTILNNWDNLESGKEGFVPSSGVILSTVTAEFSEGETVFDVLTRVCSQYGIQIEYSWTPLYGSYYIEGINNLYEFDCGPDSGWMYKVNGWFPNYGCSSYTLHDGDAIVWCYTCNGLGADVGASMG